MNIETIAEICHELNRHFCAAIGDLSQKPWCEAPKWQKESATNGVRFHLENPGASDNHSHEEWMREKLKDGWGYGFEKDESTKKHPCLVPFNELPLNQQIKDKLFRQAVHAMAPLLEH